PIRHVPAPPVDADPATTSSDLRRGSLARGSRACGPGRCPGTERSAPELAPLGWSGGYRLVSRRVNAHRTRGARNGIQNDIGGLGPDKRFRRVLVVRRDEAAQLAAEVAHAGERAATHRPPFELGEPPLDGVEPGGARRRA